MMKENRGDFNFYKTKYQSLYREVKEALKKFQMQMDRNTKNDIETSMSQQQIISFFNSNSERIQLQIDDMSEMLKEVSRLTNLQATERQVHLRLKTQLQDLQSDFQQARKLIKSQIKDFQQLQQIGHAKENGVSNRLRNLANESDSLDKTIALSSSIIQQATDSSMIIEGQTERLRNTGKNLGKIEKSAIPGAEKLIGMISRAETKNKIIIALVLAVCFTLILYGLGLGNVLAFFTPIPQVEQAGLSQETTQLEPSLRIDEEGESK